MGRIAQQGRLDHRQWQHRPNLRRAVVQAGAYDWAVEFDETSKQLVLGGDHDPLVYYQNHSQATRLSILTNKHYLPLLYILALPGQHEPIRFVADRMTFGSLSLRSIWIE